MYEIYNSSAIEYDELVNHEDYRNNLQMFLNRVIDWKDKTVIEFGVGTGRLTRMYIDHASVVTAYDRSPHMLQRARTNLAAHSKKITLSLCDNLNIHTLNSKADIVIEGWSFGHTVGDNPGNIEQTVDNLVTSCFSILNPGGKLVVIETLGTNVDSPIEPGNFLPTFYSLLETKHGFKRYVVSTDYKFASCKDAARIAGFFFGDAMKEDILRTNKQIIPEFTGIWIKEKSDQS